MPPAVDDKTSGTRNVHPLIDRGLPGQSPGRDQQISEQDERGAGPADDLDRDLHRGHAAFLDLRNTPPSAARSIPGSARTSSITVPGIQRLPTPWAAHMTGSCASMTAS